MKKLLSLNDSGCFTLIAIVFFLFGCGSSKETIQNSSDDFRFSLLYENRIDSIVDQLTLEEKVGMLHANGMFWSAGVKRLGIPEMQYADGPLGVREEIERNSWAPMGWTTDSATFFPAGGGLSATWNPQLAFKYGEAMGQEARARKKDVLLAPAINIIRTPLGGRTFEYFTEDPYLDAQIAVPVIQGIQNQDVAACVKHYAVNNQETNRGTVNVLMDERTLQEIYLPAFKSSVVDGQAYSVMGAYNKFRGDYLCQNDYLLNQVLKNEWSFKGVVISDWGAVHSTVKAAMNGLDIEMGTDTKFDQYYFAQPLIDSVKAGKIDENVIDEKVKRVLRVMYNIHKLDSSRSVGSINTTDHRKVVYDVASESVVLLKNNGSLLPLNLKNIRSIAVIGDNATRKNASGGFGAGVKAKYEVTPLEGLKNRLGNKVKINYAQGYKEQYLPSQGQRHDYGQEPDTVLDDRMLSEAVEAAKSSDIAIVFGGSNRHVESEGVDRKSMKLPFGQEALIKAVKEANPNTVVVVVAGAPFDLTKVETLVPALVWSWFNGSEAGNALADVLLGYVNPSGKLPWTLPKKLEDSPAHFTNSFPGTDSVYYDEGILVGYRWFDTKNIAPLYPFGYGMSYTTFEFAEPHTDKQEYLPDEKIRISFKIKNTGALQGKEVAQLYVNDDESSVLKPEKELKSFRKIEIAPGEEQEVSLELNASDLAFYDAESMSWKIEPGKYNLLIGTSSRDIRIKTSIIIKSPE